MFSPDVQATNPVIEPNFGEPLPRLSSKLEVGM